MSELKVHRFITTDELFPEANAGVLYYEKSEADKVIADLEESHKKEVEQLLMAIVELKKEKEYVIEHTAEVINGQERELSNNKYKRCLAMAALWSERIETSTDAENELVSLRRYNKWMELAKKFKEAK